MQPHLPNLLRPVRILQNTAVLRAKLETCGELYRTVSVLVSVRFTPAFVEGAAEWRVLSLYLSPEGSVIQPTPLQQYHNVPIPNAFRSKLPTRLPVHPHLGYKWRKFRNRPRILRREDRQAQLELAHSHACGHSTTPGSTFVICCIDWWLSNSEIGAHLRYSSVTRHKATRAQRSDCCASQAFERRLASYPRVRKGT